MNRASRTSEVEHLIHFKLNWFSNIVLEEPKIALAIDVLKTALERYNR